MPDTACRYKTQIGYIRLENIVADETREELHYLDESALLQPGKFGSTMKRGYVEETVDTWVADATTKHEELLNKYNGLVYRTLLAEQGVEELEAERNSLQQDNELLRGEVEALRANVQELQNAPVAEVQTDEAPSYYTPVQEETVEELEVPYEEEVVEEPVVEYAPVEEEVVEPVVAAPVSDLGTASHKAQRILEAAASEATEHVTRSLERVAAIEAEAQEEAEELVTNAQNEAHELVTGAQNEADGILTSATTEAEAIKVNAVNDAAEALERLEAARLTTRELFTRVTTFHQFELERAQEVFGYAVDADEEAKVTEIVVPADTTEPDNFNTVVEFTDENTVYPDVEGSEEDPFAGVYKEEEEQAAEAATDLYAYAEETSTDEDEETEAKFAGENEEVTDETSTDPAFVNDDAEEADTDEEVTFEEYEVNDESNNKDRD
jgi:hypothetical protein